MSHYGRFYTCITYLPGQTGETDLMDHTQDGQLDLVCYSTESD